MGVRPPANDNDDPDVIEFGIAALDDRLSSAEIDYPVATDELRAELGHIEVPFDAAGHTMSLGDALAETQSSEFEREQDLLNALHPIFEARRQAAGNSLLSQLRALVPF